MGPMRSGCQHIAFCRVRGCGRSPEAEGFGQEVEMPALELSVVAKDAQLRLKHDVQAKASVLVAERA